MCGMLHALVDVAEVFQVRKHKWDNYSSGEELFGLPVTKYPELEKTEKEVAMLDRLYTYADHAQLPVLCTRVVTSSFYASVVHHHGCCKVA